MYTVLNAVKITKCMYMILKHAIRLWERDRLDGTHHLDIKKHKFDVSFKMSLLKTFRNLH